MAWVWVFAASWTAYAWTAAPTAGWLDAPELVAASATLGVAHPPGHPIQVLLGRAAQLLPIGDLAFRVTLVSAACAAGAAALLCATVARLAAQHAPRADARARATIAAGVGLALAWAGGVWLQAVRPEVYALQLLLAAATLHLVVVERLAAAGLAAGLAFANHTFIALVFAAPLAVWALAARPRARAVGQAAGLVLLGLVAYVQLPLRALGHPLVNWGDAHDAGRLGWTISARAFQKSLEPGAHADGSGAAAAKTVAAFAEQLGPMGLVVFLLALYLGVRTRATRGLTLALVAVAAVVVAGRAALGFDFGNPDAQGYLAPGLLAALALVGVGLARIATLAPRASGAAAALALALPLAALGTHAGDVSQRRAVAADTWAHALADDLPPRAVVVTSYFETAFLLWQLDAVEGYRPDVEHFDRGFATHPGYAESRCARDHEICAALGGVPRVGLASGALAAGARPVRFEPDPSLDAALVDGLTLRGLWAAPHGDRAADPDAEAGADAAADAAVARVEAHLPKDPRAAGAADTRRVLLWFVYRRAQLACAAGDRRGARPGDRRVRDDAVLRLARLVELTDPPDADGAALVERCKIPPP